MSSFFSIFGITVPPGTGEIIIWGVYVFFSLLALFVIKTAGKAYFTRQVRGTKIEGGMDFGVLDKMKGSGTVTDEEAKQIRQAMARKIMQQSEDEVRMARERAILEQAAFDPDAARALLPEEIRNRKVPLAEALEMDNAPWVARPAPPHSQPDAPDPAQKSEAIKPATPNFFAVAEDWQEGAAPEPPPEKPGSASPAPAPARKATQRTTSLGATPPATPPRAPEPSMNMRKVVEAKNAERDAAATAAREGKPAPKGELEMLLEKGAISREEYDRLKQYFKPS